MVKNQEEVGTAGDTTHPLRSLQTPLLLLYIPVGIMGTVHGSQAWLVSALLCSTPGPKPYLNIADTHMVLVSLQC